MILDVQDVVCGYGEIDILRAVSVSIREGLITTIIGPNGAGKSTLLKAVFGLVRVRQGRIVFAGQDITRWRPGQVLGAGLAYVPQGRSSFPAMTVQENLEMGAFTRRDARVQADIAQILEQFSVLGRKRTQLAGFLSGGERQTLEMAMALLLHPKALLLDEPSIGLSPFMMDQVFGEVQRINAQGTTIVMVEQNVKRALAISQRAIVLELGQVRLEGNGHEILTSPDVRHLYLGGAPTEVQPG